MIDRDRCPEGIEEAARWRSRRGIPQPLAGVLCGDGGCAAHDLVTMPVSGCWPTPLDALLGPTWQVCSGLRSWHVATLPRSPHCPGRCYPGAVGIAELLESEISNRLLGVMRNSDLLEHRYDDDGVRRISELISEQLSEMRRQYGARAVIESSDYDAGGRRMNFTIRAPLVTLGSPMTFFDVDLGDDECDE